VSLQCGAVPIPLFPLHLVLFPGAHLPLHVFEPRYRQMMADVLGPDDAPRADAAFGVACIREGYEVGAPASTHDVGCLGAVEWVQRHPDGTMDILVRGTRRFRISARPPDDPYPLAEAEFLEETVGPRPDEALRLARSALDRYLSVVARLTASERSEDALPEDPTMASYAAAGVLQVETTRLQQLLEAASASERLALAAKMARSEAAMLDTVGPPVRLPQLDRSTLN
jgi:Lon protease-like protein